LTLTHRLDVVGVAEDGLDRPTFDFGDHAPLVKQAAWEGKALVAKPCGLVDFLR
jgi:hypothetical protein